MLHDTIIVRYGEIFLKSDPVRRRFEGKLISNIEYKFQENSIPYKIITRRHRIYIDTENTKDVPEILSRVFGIVSFSPAKRTTSYLDIMSGIALNYAQDIINEGTSFSVRANREGIHPYKSPDVEREIGAQIKFKTGASVDLTDPDVTIFIEIRDDEAFVFHEKFPGPGGLPAGAEGRVAALISSGIDSPAAAWMMMRRGCEVVAVHFGEVEEIYPIIEKLNRYSHSPIKIYNVKFSEIINGEILRKINEIDSKYTCIICKRRMLSKACEIAEAENAQGLVTGDNIGQVASQTLENLEVISDAASLPIYRPLLCFDKEEIIRLAKDIGTYSLQGKEECPFVPKHPATSGKRYVIKKIEENLGVL